MSLAFTAINSPDMPISDISPAGMDMLLEACLCPWAPAVTLGLRAGLGREEAPDLCARLASQGLLQAAEPAPLSFDGRALTALRYAPTPQGVQAAAGAIGLAPKALARQAQLTPQRFWLLRAAGEAMYLARRFCLGAAAAVCRATPDARVDWQIGIPRHNGRVVIHARLAVSRGDACWPYYVFIDDNGDRLVRWHETMRYLRAWSRTLKRSPKYLPPLLFVTRSVHRRNELLRLGLGLGMPDVVVATADMDVCMRQSPYRAGWHGIGQDAYQWIIEPVQIGTRQPVSAQWWKQTLHAIPTRESLRPSQVLPHRRLSKHLPDLTRPPHHAGVEAFEQLNQGERAALDFVAGSPECPASAIRPLGGVDACDLERLRGLGLAQPSHSADQSAEQAAWSLTQEGARAYAVCTCRDPIRFSSRYDFYRRDRQRRPEHTRLMFEFFERVVSDAVYAPDAKLAVFRDEVWCRVVVPDQRPDLYDAIGRRWPMHEWRPDGYGVLRVGNIATPFWVEIAGTEYSESKLDPVKWQAKISALAGYYESMRWRADYEDYPAWLIVLSVNSWRNLRSRVDMLTDLLGYSLRARSMEGRIRVLVTSLEMLREGSPLGRIWLNLLTGSYQPAHAGSAGEFVYAFPGVADNGFGDLCVRASPSYYQPIRRRVRRDRRPHAPSTAQGRPRPMTTRSDAMSEPIVSPPLRKPRRTARQCKQAAFDLPPDLLEAIDAIADRAECSKSDVLTWLCRMGLGGNTLRAMRSALDPAPKHSRRSYVVRPADFTELLAQFLSEDEERKRPF